MTDQPTAPNQRTYSLNSPEAHAALCPRSEAWIPNGALPREPRWPRPSDEMWVWTEVEVRGSRKR
jgi:hypothetical protein